MTVDEHIDQALASLGAVSMRELEATADALGNSRHPLDRFAGVFRDVALSRELRTDPGIARLHIGKYVQDEGLAELLEGAKAPFWGHVREALRALPFAQ